MKRRSPRSKIRQQRIAARSARRKLLARVKRKIRRAYGLPAYGKPGRWIRAYRNGQHVLARLVGEARPIPSVLSFDKNYDETVEFLARLRESLMSAWSLSRKPRRRRSPRSAPVFTNYWDFACIEEITVPVALIIASEYDRLGKRGAWRPHAIDIENWRPEVRAMLDEIGFLSLCGVNQKTETFIHGSGWRVLRFQSGQNADGARVDHLLQQLGVDTIFGDPRLYEAMIEALANTRHHAYPDSHHFQEPHFPGWWMTGYADENSMLIAVYDKGISIPVALADPENLWEHHEKWRQLMGRFSGGYLNPGDQSADGAAIAAAMRVGRSSTKLDYRGRGLKTFENALDGFETGRLTIRSRAGEYRKDNGTKARYITRNSAIDGTMIVWRVSKG